PQYLSEIERGVKEPSSEMIAAVAGALGVTLLDLTVAVARRLSGLRTTAEHQLVRNVPRVLALAASLVVGVARSVTTASIRPYCTAWAAVSTRSRSQAARSVAVGWAVAAAGRAALSGAA